MLKNRVLIIILFLLPVFTVHAGWRDMTGGDKAALGLGLVDIALEGKRDKKAKAAATKTLESVTYESVYTAEDCQTKYSEVLSSEQLKSDKAWVSEITDQIDSRCEQVMSANNERLLAEQTEQRELESQQRTQREKQRAKRRYNAYRAQFDDIKSMASAYGIKNWQSLYDGQYRHIINSASNKPITEKLKTAAQEFAECLQVNMALSTPNAPTAIIEKLSHTFNDHRSPVDYYEESFNVAREQCANPEFANKF